MRVVHVIDSGGFYGAEQMLVHLCQAQMKIGYEVTVISLGNKGMGEKEVEAKLKEVGVSCKAIRSNIIFFPFLSFRIIDYCRSIKPDVIHSHGYKGNLLLGWLPKSIRKVPVLTTVHGYTFVGKWDKLALYYWLDKRILHKLDFVVVVSESVRKQVNYCVPDSKLITIHNGIPAQSDSECKKFCLEKLPFVTVGSLGRLSVEKNFSVLIAAIPIIKKSIANVRLIIHGDGPERARLEELVATLGLQDSVIMPGYTKTPEKFLSSIDIFVNCSTTEGMPISILEALRQGVEIVASDIPANRYVLEPFLEDRVLVENNARSIAEAVVRIVRQTDEIKMERSLRYKKHFLNYFTVDSMVHTYSQLYWRVSDGSRS